MILKNGLDYNRKDSLHLLPLYQRERLDIVSGLDPCNHSPETVEIFAWILTSLAFSVRKFTYFHFTNSIFRREMRYWKEETNP